MAKYEDWIMEAARGRLGVNDDDTSKDSYIESLPSVDIIRMVVGWELGDESWADYVVNVLRDCDWQLIPPTDEDDWG